MKIPPKIKYQKYQRNHTAKEYNNGTEKFNWGSQKETGSSEQNLSKLKNGAVEFIQLEEQKGEKNKKTVKIA